ncbi:MAG TPA: hypothetical protein VI997_08105 [Candidatus Thermoplasmatota archaeon]|nr:hypothetical protein [Candidatus Thermoplasmatota archaeon]
MARPGSFLTLAATLLAGCLSAPAALLSADTDLPTDLAGDRLPPPDEDLSGAIVSDHGAPYMHAVPQLHHGAYRMELVGYNPLTQPAAGDGPLQMNSAWAAITIWQHYACVGHFAGSGGWGGATIVDFGDPANPTVVASIPSAMIVSRCLFTDDGKFLLVGSYGGVQPGLPLPPPAGDLLANGVSVYDVSDVKNPKFLAHDLAGVERPNGPIDNSYHNLGTVQVDGANYVFQTYSGNVLRLADDGTSLEVVATVEHSDHDMWIGKHPITQKLMMVTGAGDGTAFYDIDDPTDPVLLGVWEGSREFQGWHRQWPLAETVGGRAVMVVAGEECNNGKSLPYTTLDFTDPTNVVELGHWQIPGNPEIKEKGQLCSMNSHEFNTWHGYVATGNYHAGVWIFDAGTPERAREPVTIGYYEPHEEPRMHGGTRNTPFAWSPDVWGAYFDDRGYIIAADWYTGFYVLSFPATVG